MFEFDIAVRAIKFNLLGAERVRRIDIKLSHKLFNRVKPIIGLLTIFPFVQAEAQSAPFQPPAVPLIVHDPYFSIGSMTDCPNDDVTRHWTGTPQPLNCLLRVDGKVYRVMGKTGVSIPPLPQTGLRVYPTRSVYEFAGGGVRLTMTFLSPLLVNRPEILARPVSYIT